MLVRVQSSITLLACQILFSLTPIKILMAAFRMKMVTLSVLESGEVLDHSFSDEQFIFHNPQISRVEVFQCLSIIACRDNM